MNLQNRFGKHWVWATLGYLFASFAGCGGNPPSVHDLVGRFRSDSESAEVLTLRDNGTYIRLGPSVHDSGSWRYEPSGGGPDVSLGKGNVEVSFTNWTWKGKKITADFLAHDSEGSVRLRSANMIFSEGIRYSKEK